MKCKNCKNEMPDELHFTFCGYCGERLIRERKKKNEIKVPKPRQRGKRWYLELRKEGVTVIEDTEAEAIAKAQAIRAGFIEAEKKPESITLKEACKKHIETKRGKVTPSTLDSYERIVKNHFTGLMNKNVGEITDADLDLAVSRECTRTGRNVKQLKPKTVVNAYNFIITVLHKYNEELGKNVTLPEVPRKVPQIVTAEKIVPLIVGTEIELPCLLAMWMQMSLSEILGLTKSKSIIDNKLYIVETVVYIKGKAVRREGGKEETRTRAFDIPPYIKALIDKVPSDELVTLSGAALTTRFERLLEKNGLPHMSFHKLRHLGASISAMLGNPDVDTQARGGWKTDYTMKQVYLHSFSESRLQSDAKINDYFNSLISG